MNNVCIFTIVSKNYTHVARALMHSVEQYYPEANRVVALCDKPDDFDYSRDNFEIFNLGRLDNIPSFEKFLFRYTILELNTAIKPYVIEKLFDLGYEKVIYIDPDIKIYSSLIPMVNLLDSKEILLTPHLTGELDDEALPSELDILRSGTYNLGYIGLRDSQSTRSLIKWWQGKLYKDCVVDLERGLFVDQKWIDMVPGIFEGVHVERNEGWNVAYWNLAHRKVVRSENGFQVNKDPLVFFHFSGFNSSAKTLSKHQNRFTRTSAGAGVEALCKDYAADLIAFGQDTCRELPYAFGQFADGTAIPDQARYIYRDDFDWESDSNNLWSEEGSKNFMGYLNQPIEHDGLVFSYITRLAHRLYRERKDLQDAFPDIYGTDGVRYAQWFIDNAGTQAKFNDCFIAPIRSWLEQNIAKKKSPGTSFYRLLYRLARYSRAIVRPILPPEIRHRINLALIRRSNSDYKPSAQTPKSNEFGVNLFGYVHAESGVGQSARSNIQSLTSVNIPVSVIDVRLGNISRMDGHIDASLKGEPAYRTNLFHINADQLEFALGEIGLHVLEDCFNIGFWAWELPDFPVDWASASKYLDEIWTPSEFCKASIEKQVDIPVVVVPHAIWLEHEPSNEAQGLGVDFKPFTFYTMFDCLSVPERKNVRAAIKAFEQAFDSTKDDVQFVVKVLNLDAHNDFSDYLLEEAASNQKIKLIDQYFDRDQVFSLLSRIDCFVSLHRSEGFGLGIAEAMLFGKPVIATDWSGNTDFCNAENSLPVNYELIKLDKNHGPYKKGQTWADPSASHAAAQMKLVFSDEKRARKIGLRAAADVKERLSPSFIGAMLHTRLSRIHQILIG